jgi:hypothetical protein
VGGQAIFDLLRNGVNVPHVAPLQFLGGFAVPV